MKRFDDAMREIQEVERLDASNVKAQYRKATIQYAMTQYDEALMTLDGIKDEKLTGQLKKQIQAKIQKDEVAIKELAQKMVSGDEPKKEEKKVTAEPKIQVEAPKE